jgi:phosphoglycerate dehydrogenase-like enzyme
MEELGFELVKELDDFLPQCDVVSLHLGCKPLLKIMTAGR